MRPEAEASRLRSTPTRQASCGDRAAGGLGVELGLRADGLGSGARGARQSAGRTAQAALAQRSATDRSHAASAAPLQPRRPGQERRRRVARQAPRDPTSGALDRQVVFDFRVGLSGRQTGRADEPPQGHASCTAWPWSTPINTCSTPASASIAIPTIPSFAALATCTTARWKARCGSSRSRAAWCRARRTRFARPIRTVEATIVLQRQPGEPRISRSFASSPTTKSSGLQNHYHNYGLGVPLIAVRKHHGGEDPEEKFYPPG